LAAYQHFKLRHDPFTTLSLQPHNLEYFIGRDREVDRLAAALFALHNVGLAGEAGSGKSTLMQRVRNRVTKDFHAVSIGSPMGDPAYLLTELLRELLLVLPHPRGLFSKDWEKKLRTEKPGKNVLL
jgi:ABC-type phosphonate transport system ATPase subunit